MARLQHNPKEYVSPLAGTPRWQIRTMSQEPTPIDHTEEMYGKHREAMERAYLIARRTSYVNGGPNREVCVSIEIMHQPSQKWETVFEAKTRLREGGKPA